MADPDRHGKHLLYLHGRWVELHGRRAYSDRHRTSYEYDKIVAALAGRGFSVKRTRQDQVGPGLLPNNSPTGLRRESETDDAERQARPVIFPAAGRFFALHDRGKGTTDFWYNG